MPRPKQSKKIFDGFDENLVVDPLILLPLKFGTNLDGIQREHDMKIEPSEQSLTAFNHDARKSFDLIVRDIDFAESLAFYSMLP